MEPSLSLQNVIETAATSSRFDAIDARIEAITSGSDSAGLTPVSAAAEMLRLGEVVMELWIEAHGQTPTIEKKEGFRLIALHRQGAKGEPSFNACRETCRELVYHYNLIVGEPEHADSRKRLALMALVAKHLVYFVEGKLTVEGLGEFCCAAKPVRAGDGV